MFTGDCLEVLRGIDDSCIDLIYLDPPFNSKHNYAAPIGSKATGAAFKDRWTLDDIDLAWVGMIADERPELYKAIQATQTKSDRAYLVYMAIRMMEMQRVLKDTGSIYLHCDLTMSAWLKITMDAIFGRKNFMNKVIWHYQKPHSSRRNYPKTYDTILYYVKRREKAYVFNYEATLFKYNTKAIDRYDKIDQDGRRYKVYNNKDGTIRRSYMKDGKPDNVFDIPFVQGTSKERIGYPTQKPLALLERIIEVSSRKGDFVLDPFCGCATSCVAAERLGRKWIGIDLSAKSAELVKVRAERELSDLFLSSGPRVYEIIHRSDTPKRTDGVVRSPDIKHRLYGRQEGLCNGCKNHFLYHNMSINRIIPKSEGGLDTNDNLQLLCGACNSAKGKLFRSFLPPKQRRQSTT